MKKKLSTKISKDDLETWNNFIKETRSVEDKDIKLSPEQNFENTKTYDQNRTHSYVNTYNADLLMLWF